MKKLLQLLVVFFFVFSCTKDTFEEQKVDDTNQRIVQNQFDNSHMGVYKGLFTTVDGLTRGSVVVTLSPSNEGIAQITLSSGEMIELKSSRVKLSLDNTISNLRFSSAGLSEIDVTLEFSVEGDGLNPMITNVNFDNKESDIFIAKNLSRAPLTPITGTYVRTAGSGGFPTSGRTWNIMSIGAGDAQIFATQIAYGGRVYNTPAIDNVQFNCATAGYTTCNIAGSASILGYEVSWNGTHKYNPGNAGNDNQCAEVSGTWSAPTFGGSSGTFISDTNCSGPAVANDLCAGAISVGAGTYLGSTANATSTGNPGTCTTTLNTGPGVWYSYTPTTAALVQVNTTGSAFDTKLGVLRGSCAALVCVAGNDDNPDGGLQSRVNFSATVGVTYYFYVTGFQTASGNYTLNVIETLPPANDLCTTATPIACGGTASGSTAAATNTGAPATCTTTLNTAPGVWYSFSTPTAKRVTVNTIGSNFDTKLGVFRGTCGAGLICVLGNDEGGFGISPQSQVVFDATAGTTYYYYVTGAATTTGNFVLNNTCADPPTVPTNDLCANAATIACGGTASGNTTLANATGAPTATCGTSLNTAPGVWYNFTTPTAQVVSVTTTGGNYDTKLGVFSGACTGLVCVGGNDDGGPEAALGKSQVVFTATAGTAYKIYVTGFSTGIGAFNLSVTCTNPPPPVVFSLTPACGTTLVDNGGNANYSNNRNDTYSINAGAGNVVRLPLTVFNLENTWDFMRIYNSPNGVTLGTEIVNVNGRVILNGGNGIGFTGTGTGANSLQGQTVVSSGQYLIVRFISDGTTTAAGFLATVGCAPARTADYTRQQTSDIFMPSRSSVSVPKVIVNEERDAQEYERKKLEAYQKSLNKDNAERRSDNNVIPVFATDAEKAAYLRKRQ